jgi:hypothetical protein
MVAHDLWPTRARVSPSHQAVCRTWARKSFHHLGHAIVQLIPCVQSDPMVARHFWANKTQSRFRLKNPSLISHFADLIPFCVAHRPPAHTSSGPMPAAPRRPTTARVPHALPQLLPPHGTSQTGPPFSLSLPPRPLKWPATMPHSPFLSFLLSQHTAWAPSLSPRPLIRASGQTAAAPRHISGYRSPSTVSSPPHTSPLRPGDPSPSPSPPPPQAVGGPRVVTGAHLTPTNSYAPISVAASPSPEHAGKPRSVRSCPTPPRRPLGARRLNLIAGRAPPARRPACHRACTACGDRAVSALGACAPSPRHGMFPRLG